MKPKTPDPSKAIKTILKRFIPLLSQIYISHGSGLQVCKICTCRKLIVIQICMCSSSHSISQLQFRMVLWMCLLFSTAALTLTDQWGRVKRLSLHFLYLVHTINYLSKPNPSLLSPTKCCYCVSITPLAFPWFSGTWAIYCLLVSAANKILLNLAYTPLNSSV